MSTAGEISGGGKRYYAEPRTHKRHNMDFYTEPAWTVEALLRQESFCGLTWDPACGSGTIPKTFLAHGLHAVGSDAAERPFGERHDFLATLDARPFHGVENIVCNPPYGRAAEFIERALGIASVKVAMLLQSKFPYSQRRHRLFTQHRPARLYFLSDRPSMPPGDKLLAGTVEAKGGKLDYLWMVWHKGPLGEPTTCHWLRRAGA